MKIFLKIKIDIVAHAYMKRDEGSLKKKYYKIKSVKVKPYRS